MSKDKKPKKITIFINRKPYHLEEGTTMTGAQLKELASEPLDYLLVLVVDKPDEQAGGDDVPVNNDQVVELENKMRFRVVNPATFG